MSKLYNQYLIIYLILSGLFLPNKIKSQSYTFSPGINYVYNIDTNSTDFGGIEILNTGTQNLNLTWKQSLTDTLADSRFELCNSGICSLNMPHSGIMPTIAPGGTGWIKFHMYSGIATGTNTIKYILKNGITQVDTLTFNIIVSSSTGLQEHSGFNNIFLYPNPTTNETTVNVNLMDQSDVAVTVMNNIGQVVYQTMLILSSGSNKVTLDTRNYPSGLYNVVIASEKGSVTKKLSVSK